MTSTTHPVVAGFDGHDRAPVCVAEVLAGLLGAPLHIATGYDCDAEGSASETTADANRQRFRTAVAQQDRALHDHGDGASASVIAMERPASGLLDVAHELDACLITLGCDQHGHVAQELVRAARCPVVVACEQERFVHAPPRSVGVAFDGSHASRLALAAAHQIAIRAGARLEVIACQDDRLTDSVAARAAAESAADLLTVETQHSFRRGDTAAELRRAAEHLDLLVCGSRGRGRISTRLLGSVASSLIDRPPCAVMVVPDCGRRVVGAPLGLSTAAAAVTPSVD